MINIVSMGAEHAAPVFEMMQTFYASPAVYTNGSEEIFRADIEACVGESPFLEGFVFLHGEEIVGYCMVAKSFSTEFGRPCVWIEDLYLRPNCRGKGVAGQVFAFLEKRFPGTVLRLEVEEENVHAVRAYEKAGFSVIPYEEMIKLL